MLAASKIIWIQHGGNQPSRLVNGFGICKTLIPNFSDGMWKALGNLFMYPQLALIKKVNKLASCRILYKMERINGYVVKYF